MPPILHRVAIITVVGGLSASSAVAQPQPAPPPQPQPAPPPGTPYGTQPAYPGNAAPQDPFQHHRGVMVGFGLGIGVATCTDDCDSETSLALDFHLGGFLNPQLALMYDVGGWFDSENDVSLLIGSNTFAAQYWVGPNVWIKGGLGLSQIRISGGGDSDSEFGTAATGGAGVEIMQSGGFALDVSGRLSLLSFDDVSTTFVLLNAVLGARWK